MKIEKIDISEVKEKNRGLVLTDREYRVLSALIDAINETYEKNLRMVENQFMYQTEVRRDMIVLIGKRFENLEKRLEALEKLDKIDHIVDANKKIVGYKLKKDLPDLKADAVFVPTGNGDFFAYSGEITYSFHKDRIKSLPDWFEPVEG